MAHRFKVRTIAGLNKDGSVSKTKKSHIIVRRSRGKKVLVDIVNAKRDIAPVITLEREELIQAHLDRHPNDMAFKKKHGLV